VQSLRIVLLLSLKLFVSLSRWLSRGTKEQATMSGEGTINSHEVVDASNGSAA
jgi:hypothetical protein